MKKNSLTLNEMKIIAILAMLIDHIGYYFYYSLSEELYLVLRIIGRISMPIFVFCLIQGYFHTKNLKNYIYRLFGLALITQIFIFALGYINKLYISDYSIGVYSSLNIVFSFVLSIILIYLFDKIVLSSITIFNNVKKIDKKTYKYIASIFLILAIYWFIPIDYRYVVPAISVVFYIAQKINCNTNNIDRNSKKILIFTCVGILIFIIGAMSNYLNSFLVLSMLFILLYNGKKGSNSKYSRLAFYIIFPIQHVVLYGLSMFLYYLNIRW
ncbi:MAG: conjugal transfer protein TraX [Clostridia bacterium]|nr:conjugal transfer protein TraX [Clostridia bacterium]